MSVREIRAGVSSFGFAQGATPQLISDIALAVSEAATNAVPMHS